ncbi:metal/formaldehyde-sensitive transcriptional repressor [Chitinilyticum litopenaei]|uniref:metal/formaldehyde-sensitive transcriptional repressor n=1 Tax=Chitinilyticum litopenaei TaxID=1121276 RepID=UPI00048F2B44|nr:metal/formaldehyde-sensitive transcriptional repressor [Chitinilyticum litopenaei]
MHTIHDKAKLLARVRRIQGQAAALETQLEQEGDCKAVLQQIAAIRGAVSGLMAAVIEGHLSEHVVKEPALEQRQQDLETVLQVIKTYLK